jgi:hypothetical protein
MSWYQTADDTSERTQAPTSFEPGEARLADTRACPRSGRGGRDDHGGITGLARWLIGAFAGAALIGLFVHVTAHTPPRIATITHTSVTSHVAGTPSGELSPEPAPAVAAPEATPVPTPREVIPSVPPPPTARRAVLTSATRGGTVNVQPAVVVESVPTGSPYSPLITFTVENPRGMCHVTIQFSPRASGRHAGLLVIPVGGSPTQTASLRADAT